jgi:hypothetical protein
MSNRIVKNDLPRGLRRSVAARISSVLPNGKDGWKVSLTADPRNHAWDVEVSGPRKFHWERRFSGDDRDAEVIAESIRAALQDSPKSSADRPASRTLGDALSALASQGIAFTSDTSASGEKTYIVDRVELKENEILSLYNQGALTTDGIRRHLLTRS